MSDSPKARLTARSILLGLLLIFVFHLTRRRRKNFEKNTPKK